MDEVNRLTRLWKLYDLCFQACGDNDYEVTEPLHEQETEWVLNAISNSHIIPTEKIRSITFYLFANAINRENNDHINDINDILIELKDITEDMNNAKEFVKLGGLDIIECLITDCDSRLRCNGFELLGIINQNDHFCQMHSVDKDLVERLLQTLPMETDIVLIGKLVYALSCTVRGNEIAFQRFVQSNGFELLLDHFLSSSSARLRCKIAFFMNSLCTEMDISQIRVEALQRCLNSFSDRLIEMSSFCEPEVEYMVACVHRIMSQYRNLRPDAHTVLLTVLIHQTDVLSNSDTVEETCDHMRDLVPLLRSHRTTMLN